MLSSLSEAGFLAESALQAAHRALNCCVPMLSQVCASARTGSSPLLRATQSLLEALRTCMPPALYLDSLTQMTQLQTVSQEGIRTRAWRQLAQHTSQALQGLDDERKAHAVTQLCRAAAALGPAEAASHGADAHHSVAMQRNALAALSAVVKVGMVSGKLECSLMLAR